MCEPLRKRSKWRWINILLMTNMLLNAGIQVIPGMVRLPKSLIGNVGR
jgi:hypothetical protein